MFCDSERSALIASGERGWSACVLRCSKMA